MIIKYYGHSCFSITSNDYTIVLDPFNDVQGFKDVDLEANEVICSHGHGDHSYTDGVNIISKDNSPFDVNTIKVFHDDSFGSKRGPNNITVLTVENKKIAHLGDLGHLLDEETLKQLSNIDVLMIPIGGFYTIDSKQALEIINKINPKYIIPMHYKDGDLDYEVLEDIDSFLNNAIAYQDRLLLVRGYQEQIEI